MKACQWALFAFVVGLGVQGFAGPIAAQDKLVERAAKGPSGKEIRVGVYLNILPDCSSGPLPTIWLISAPANGKLTVKKAKASATNYKQCLALEIPAYVAVYRSQPNFAGSDTMTIEIRYEGGRTEVQRITVTIELASGKGI